jgi:hypothetical protein
MPTRFMAHPHVDGQIILLSYTENNTFLYKQKNLTNVVRIIEQRIGRIRFAEERQPGDVNIHLTGGLPMGSSKNPRQPVV